MKILNIIENRANIVYLENETVKNDQRVTKIHKGRIRNKASHIACFRT